MSNKSIDVSVIIPVRSESEVIKDTLTTLIKNIKLNYEIIVVNDCIDKNDTTIDEVIKFSKNNKNILIYSKTKKDQYGFGHSLWQGIKISSGKYVIFVMADLCDNPKDINKMYKLALSGYDIVCASRYISEGKKIGGPFIQGISSYIVNVTLKLLLDLPVSDASNSFKMYKKEVLMRLPKPKTSGFEISLETYLNCFFLGIKSIEFPTIWLGRTKGNSKFRMVKRFPNYMKIYYWAIKQKLKIIFGFKSNFF